MSAPRVCLVSDEYPPDIGGVGTSVQRIATALNGAGHHVTVVVLDDDAEEDADPLRHADHAFSVLRVGFNPALGSRAGGEARVAARIAAALARGHFDIVHAFFVTRTFLHARWIAKSQDAALVASFRGNDIHHGVFSRELPTVQLALQEADVTTYPNLQMKDMAESVAGTTALVGKHYRIVHNGVRVPSNDDDREPLLERPLVVATSGVLRAKKGLATLIAATSLLPKRSVKLLLIGDLAPTEALTWQHRLDTAGIDYDITGFVRHQEVEEHLRRSHVYVQASLYDGCPNGLLEAAALSLPLVCSSIPPFREFFRDGEECLLFDPYEPKTLAARFTELANDGSLREQLGLAAHRAVQDRFSVERELRSWLAVYDAARHHRQHDNGTKPWRSIPSS